MVDLPQPEFADDSQCLALADREGHIVHRLHGRHLAVEQPATHRKVLAQTFDQEQRLRRAAAIAGIRFDHLFSLTSMAERNPSLIRLKHIEVTKIITPGSAAT